MRDGGVVVVMGGGVAGLAAAVLLARDGRTVTVLERDAVTVGEPDASPRWHRRGIPHFLQPHAFIPRGRLELRTRLPDVYDALLSAGAEDVDLRRKLPGEPCAEDEELQYLAVRRPLIEWGLRRAALDEPRVDIRSGVDVAGLAVERDRVVGVRAGRGQIDADLVVDALGRRSPTPSWLADAGMPQAPPETSDCGVVYYSRYYRQRHGFELPDGPFLLSPRGDLGYFGYASFPGDNRTFAAVLAMPKGVAEWRAVKKAPAFEAAVGQIPALRAWVDPDGVDPITDVLPMAGLQNSIRSFEPSRARGVVPVGDAVCHTDPTLAHGLSFALVHAAALTDALREHGDIGDAVEAYTEATTPALRERYELATALDDQRLRMWLGDDVDVGRRDRDYALFTIVAAGAVATVDPDVFRVFVRRSGLLDSTTVLDHDVELQRRIEDRFHEMRSARPPAGPPREEMLAAVRATGS